jgi:toxin ParE1/3/4
MRRYRLSSLARQDLADIRRYIARDRPVAADRQVSRLIEKFRLLARNPELGERQPQFSGGLRRFVMGSYVIFYRFGRQGVEIVRVVSGYRDIDALF